MFDFHRFWNQWKTSGYQQWFPHFGNQCETKLDNICPSNSIPNVLDQFYWLRGDDGEHWSIIDNFTNKNFVHHWEILRCQKQNPNIISLLQRRLECSEFGIIFYFIFTSCFIFAWEIGVAQVTFLTFYVELPLNLSFSRSYNKNFL